MTTETAPRLRVVSDGGEHPPASDDASTPAPTAEKPPRNKGGRPKGSKNRITADARELLAKHGIAGLKSLCAFAAGRPVFRQLRGGARERIDPTAEQMLAAQKAILPHLVPALKSTESTVDQTVTDKTHEELMKRFNGDERQYNRHMARAILSTFDSAGFRLYVEEETRDIVQQIADDEAARMTADSDGTEEITSGVAHRPPADDAVAAGDGTSSAAPSSEPLPAIGSRRTVGDKVLLEVVAHDGDGSRAKYLVSDFAGNEFGRRWGDEAEAFAQELIDGGHIRGDLTAPAVTTTMPTGRPEERREMPQRRPRVLRHKHGEH